MSSRVSFPSMNGLPDAGALAVLQCRLTWPRPRLRHWQRAPQCQGRWRSHCQRHRIDRRLNTARRWQPTARARCSRRRQKRHGPRTTFAPLTPSLSFEFRPAQPQSTRGALYRWPCALTWSWRFAEASLQTRSRLPKCRPSFLPPSHGQHGLPPPKTSPRLSSSRRVHPQLLAERRLPTWHNAGTWQHGPPAPRWHARPL
mmetsp:Transcript_67962/g.196796  ORF Transcript_67962/g.196796 Transcript_67962/m.196796 type:complete len:200 (-) Transcript_67962:557-1156(-)